MQQEYRAFAQNAARILEIGAIGKRVFKETGTWKFYISFQHLFLIIQAVSITNKFAHYINSRNSKTKTQEEREI